MPTKEQKKEKKEVARKQLAVNQTWKKFVEARNKNNYQECSHWARDFLNLSKELEENDLNTGIEYVKYLGSLETLEKRIIEAESSNDWKSVFLLG